MEELDYIVVGFGLAGLAFSRELERQKKSFVVFENNSQQSSKVAGGMYNPVILKRFTPVWDAGHQLEMALPFYKELEQLLGTAYDVPIPVGRLLTSVEEQNNWFATSDHPALSKYMIPSIDYTAYKGVEAPFGWGKLRHTGRLKVSELLHDYQEHLLKKKQLIKAQFDYTQLTIDPEFVRYANVKAKQIVFCEGYGMKLNPFFKYLPLNEVKGELITIEAPELKLDFVLKSGVFIMPIAPTKFIVGATFNWKDKTNIPSEEGKRELQEKLDKIIKVPYTIVDHVAGIRPTVIDRRPLIGKHPKYERLAILNGLGTRGVMIAPAMAIALYKHIEQQLPLRKEIAIERFNL